MSITTVAVDLAKDVFEIAEADASGRTVKRVRIAWVIWKHQRDFNPDHAAIAA